MVRMSKWVRFHGSTRQPDKKNMGRVKNINSSIQNNSIRQIYWPVGPAREPKWAGPHPV